MVKVRGFRVDIQEVENAIAQRADVRQCAVVVANDHDGSAMLVGFVSPAGVACVGVFVTLREQLPDYMVPSRVIALDALPLTASGKIDRRTLLETWASQAAATTPACRSRSARKPSAKSRMSWQARARTLGVRCRIRTSSKSAARR